MTGGHRDTIGIDVGGTYAKSVRVRRSGDGDFEFLDRREDPVPDDGVLDFVGSLVVDRIDSSTAVGGLSPGSDDVVVAVGVGVAGLVRWPEGVFVWGPHVNGRDVPYRDTLQKRLARPVVVDNDANFAALAEARLGAGRGFKHVVMVTFGTGIGAGLVMDGRIHRGRSFAGEVGHIPVESGGARCACGRTGCWETRVSGARFDALARQLAEAAPEGQLAGLARGTEPTGRHLTEAADAGDSAARRVLAEAGRWLGQGVLILVTILDPDVVVIGGAAAEAGRWLLEPAKAALEDSMPGSEHRPPVPLVAAELGRWAGAIGAGLAASEEGLNQTIVDQPRLDQPRLDQPNEGSGMRNSG